MLMSIPVISPIEIALGPAAARRLSAPDYEIYPLSLADAAPALPPSANPAIAALDEIERAAQVSEYHDFSWWDERVRIIRAAIAE